MDEYTYPKTRQYHSQRGSILSSWTCCNNGRLRRAVGVSDGRGRGERGAGGRGSGREQVEDEPGLSGLALFFLVLCPQPLELDEIVKKGKW